MYMMKLLLQMFLFKRAGWVECWTVPSVVFTIDYSWHPIYPQKADEQLKQSCKCKYVFLPSMFHFRKCCDCVGSNFLNFQKFILNWTAFVCGCSGFFWSKVGLLIFISHLTNFFSIQDFRKYPNSLWEKEIPSMVSSSLSVTVSLMGCYLKKIITYFNKCEI